MKIHLCKVREPKLKKKKPETEPNDNENASPQEETEQGGHVREEEPDNDEKPDAINQARENLDPKPEFFTRTKLLVTQCVFLQLRVKPKPGEK